MSAGRIIWGVVLIGLGVLFLATNMGWVDWGFALSLLQLWPLILVLIGINLLLGDRSRTLAVVLMVLVLVAGVAVAAATWQNDGWHGWGKETTTAIEGPATAGVSQARADIQVGGAELDIAGKATGRVVQGTFESRGDPTIRHAMETTTGTYALTVDQAETSWMVVPFASGHEKLDLLLAPDLPWNLQVQTGATDATLDLSDVTLQRLTLKSGASSVKLTVGPRVAGGRADVTIDSGVGTCTIKLPRTLDITLRADTGVSSVHVDSAFTDSGNDTFVYHGGGDALTVLVKAGVSTLSVQLY